MPTTRQRLQIPLPGGSGLVPTGAVQFQGDWPGLFLRGDDACGIADTIRQLQRKLVGATDPEVPKLLAILAHYAAMIERDVKV